MAAYANLVIDQGSTFTTALTVEDADGNVQDLSGFTAYASIRKTYRSVTATAFDQVSIGNPTAGEVTMRIDGATSQGMKPGRYVYDVIVMSGGNVPTRVLEGQLEITPSVTRDYT